MTEKIKGPASRFPSIEKNCGKPVSHWFRILEKPKDMRQIRLFLMLICSFCASIASADGYQQWKFGMTREEVKAVTDHGPYYSFQNGDLGSQSGPIDGALVPISFYFTNDTLERVMLILYQGEDVAMASEAWKRAVTHLQTSFDAFELKTNPGTAATVEQAEATLDIIIDVVAVGEQLQAGALPMPDNVTVWTTFSHLRENLYMVVVNYAAR